MNTWKDEYDEITPFRNYIDASQKSRGNYRNYLFQITPKLHYNIHLECESTLNIYKQVKRSIKLKNSFDQDLEAMRKNLEERLKKLAVGLEKEKNENKELLEKMKDEYITFGSEVQLYHYDSKSFITVNKECENISKIGYICELSTYFSKRMVMKILPKLKSRLEGEHI